MPKTEAVEVLRLRGASIFKLVLLGSTVSWTALGLVFGALALAGFDVVQWNGDYLAGVRGLVAAPMISALAGLLWGVVCAVGIYLGLRLYALFRPLTLEFVLADEARKHKNREHNDGGAFEAPRHPRST